MPRMLLCVYEWKNKKTHVPDSSKENESEKKELNKILKERKLDQLDEQPQPTECLCIRKIGNLLFVNLE